MMTLIVPIGSTAPNTLGRRHRIGLSWVNFTGLAPTARQPSKAVTEVSQGLAQKMYAKQAEAAQPGADADASSGGAESNDDAVDAEFEEVKDEK